MPAPSNQPKAGGYTWRAKLIDLIRSEQAEVDNITALMKQASRTDTMLVLGELLARKTVRLGILYELLNMRDD